MKNVQGIIYKDGAERTKKIIRFVDGEKFFLMKEEVDGKTDLCAYHDATPIIETWYWVNEKGDKTIPYNHATDGNSNLNDAVRRYITKPYSPWMGCHWSHDFSKFTDTGCEWTYNRPIGD